MVTTLVVSHINSDATAALSLFILGAGQHWYTS